MDKGDFTRKCCPVVLEIKCTKLRKVPGKKTFCSEASIGSEHRGLLIKKLHFNLRFMENYMNLESPEVRNLLRTDSLRCRLCACNISGAISTPNDPFWVKWRCSGAKRWYHPQCYDNVSGSRTTW